VYRFILQAVKGDKTTAHAIFEDYLAGKLSDELLSISRRCVSADQAGLSNREIEEGLGDVEANKSRRGAGVSDNALLLRFREYVEAAKLARHCAESERNPHAKQILQEIERSYHRLVEIEKWAVDQQQYNRPFAHFGLFNGHAGRTWFAMREDIVSRSADQEWSPPERPPARWLAGERV
jgi:hypothetical protein